jgi:hypothetical protein
MGDDSSEGDGNGSIDEPAVPSWSPTPEGPLYEGATVTTDQAAYGFAKLKADHGLTNAAMEAILKWVKCIMSEGNRLAPCTLAITRCWFRYLLFWLGRVARVFKGCAVNEMAQSTEPIGRQLETQPRHEVVFIAFMILTTRQCLCSSMQMLKKSIGYVPSAKFERHMCPVQRCSQLFDKLSRDEWQQERNKSEPPVLFSMTTVLATMVGISITQFPASHPLTCALRCIDTLRKYLFSHKVIWEYPEKAVIISR